MHGLSNEFLLQHKRFADIVAEFIDFIEDSPLVAHNAEFDTRFLNAELALVDLPALAGSRIVDTLAMARRLNPGSPASLDALCQRYGIDSSRREKHGALLDAGLLAEVYAELCGGRQAALSLQATSGAARRNTKNNLMTERPQPLASRLSASEIDAHQKFIETLAPNPLWARYLDSQQDKTPN